MTASRVLIVTPTYNERDNLEPFLAGVFEVLPSARVLVVDDASPDGTGDLADAIAKKDRRVSVLHRASKLGLGTAYLDGFRWGLRQGGAPKAGAPFDVFVEMDTDLSHDPRYLPDFLSAIDQGADVVIGSRNIPGGGVEGWGPGRHLLSKGGSLYSRAILGLPVADLTSGYKAFRRSTLESLRLDDVRSNGYSFQVELTFRAALQGLDIVEVPIIFVDRRAGQSKMSRRVFAEAVLMVPALRLRALLGRL